MGLWGFGREVPWVRVAGGKGEKGGQAPALAPGLPRNRKLAHLPAKHLNA